MTVRALVEGKVTAANIFSTSPAIPQNHLVVLDDPEHNFLAGNIVPLVNSQKKSDRLKDVLDAVSAKLTSAGLAALNAAVAGNAGIDPDQAARNWVRDNGFNHPNRPMIAIFDNVSKVFADGTTAVDQLSLRSRRQADGFRRFLRQRQDHGAADDQPDDRADLRHHHRRR